MKRSSLRIETIPLLHDNHSHAALYAAMASCPDIAALDAGPALSFLESLPADRLSVVRGWRTNELPLDQGELGALPPLLLINFSLHGFALSDAALPIVSGLVPDLAANRDDPDWREANVPRLFDAYCGLSGLDGAKLASFLDGLKPLGIGSSEDMTLPNAQAARAILDAGLKERIAFWAAPGVYRTLDAECRAACSGVKLFLDGSIGARTAAIRGPWLGGGAGILTYSDDTLLAELENIASWKTGLSVHAIGELAIDQALSSLACARANGASWPLVRLEHVQLISRDQAFRARDMGLVLSMQPNFTSDSTDYADRLPKASLEGNNPFRMLIDQAGFRPGKDLIFGSDGMPHGIANPASLSLFPPYPGQLLSLEELVTGYGPARGVSGSVSLEIDEAAGSARVLASG